MAGDPGCEPHPCSNAALRRATRNVGQLFDEALAPSGLRATQHGLLATIRQLGRPTMSEVAEIMVMDLSGLGHTLKPLVRDGYINVVPDRADRRARRIAMTDRGRAKLAETTPLWRAAQARFEASFGAEQAAALRGALAILATRDFRDAFRGVGGDTAPAGDA